MVEVPTVCLPSGRLPVMITAMRIGHHRPRHNTLLRLRHTQDQTHQNGTVEDGMGTISVLMGLPRPLRQHLPKVFNPLLSKLLTRRPTPRNITRAIGQVIILLVVVAIACRPRMILSMLGSSIDHRRLPDSNHLDRLRLLNIPDRAMVSDREHPVSFEQ